MIHFTKEEVNKSVNELCKMADNLHFDLARKSEREWDLEKKSYFIHSLICGFSLPHFYAKDSNDEKLWILDGKEYLLNVISFCNNEFKLHKDTPKIYNMSIVDNSFENLPEEFQQKILNTIFTIYLLKGDDKIIKKLSECKGSISDFLQVGDFVDDAFVDYFVEVLPPKTWTNDIIQMGEPFSHVQGKATYLTLANSLEGWRYAGICHAGKTINLH